MFSVFFSFPHGYSTSETTGFTSFAKSHKNNRPRRCAGDQHIAFSYSFMPEVTIPRMNCFWKIRKTISTGTIATTDMANRLFQSTEYSPLKFASAHCRVYRSLSRTTSRGHIYSFQRHMNEKIASTLITGRAIGSIRCRNVRVSLAPSIRAASFSSFGTE